MNIVNSLFMSQPFSVQDSFTGHIRMFCACRRFCPRLRIDLRTKCIIVEKMSLFEGQFRDKGVTAHRPQLITRSSSPGSLRSSKLFCSSWPAVYPSMLITSLYNKKKMPIFMDIFFFMLVLKLVVKRESLECNNFNIFVY